MVKHVVLDYGQEVDYALRTADFKLDGDFAHVAASTTSSFLDVPTSQESY